MNECEETEGGVHPSETPLCGQHDNQTKAQSPEKQQIPDSQALSKPMVHIQALSRSASLSPRRDFRDYPSSDSKKDVATADGDSFWSSDSWLDSGESSSSDSEDVATSDDDSDQSSHSRISLGRNVSSKLRRVSSKRTKTFIRTTFKKKRTRAMCQFKKTEEGVHLSETPLCGQHDNQTKAQSPEQEPDIVDWFGSIDWFMTERSPPLENEKTSSPITQELVVGSSGGMETKSMYPPVAVQTSPPQLSSSPFNKKQSLKGGKRCSDESELFSGGMKKKGNHSL